MQNELMPRSPVAFRSLHREEALSQSSKPLAHWLAIVAQMHQFTQVVPGLILSQ